MLLAPIMIIFLNRHYVQGVILKQIVHFRHRIGQCSMNNCHLIGLTENSLRKFCHGYTKFFYIEMGGAPF